MSEHIDDDKILASRPVMPTFACLSPRLLMVVSRFGGLGADLI
ncbi:Uncharacterised protein [Moraxella bovis]|uniref:Uncharacterized protein n=1 Tax=Moraxella bovis TaxID=476 RepID=A0A378Q365_MORBO|nr:Uncharacterised protein [Moraxella bovis]